MDIMTLALIFLAILAVLGLITIWMGFPGTILVLGGALVYDLFVRATTMPWEAYIVMFTLLAIGEIGDVVLTSYWKRSPKSAVFLRTVVAIVMIAVFILSL